MKQSVSPAVFVVAIVVVVALACFFGYRALFPFSTANLSPADYKAKMQHSVAEQQSNMDKAHAHAPTGGHGAQSSGGSSAQYQEYLRRQQSGQH